MRHIQRSEELPQSTSSLTESRRRPSPPTTEQFRVRPSQTRPTSTATTRLATTSRPTAPSAAAAAYIPTEDEIDNLAKIGTGSLCFATKMKRQDKNLISVKSTWNE